MELIAADYDINSSEPTILLHEDDCALLGAKEGARVRISGNGYAVAIATVSDTLLPKGTVRVPARVMACCGISCGDPVNVDLSHTPDSVRSIRNKMDGMELDFQEIAGIIDDVVAGKLSRIEISAWLTALYIKGMTVDEIVSYAEVMAESGGRLELSESKVYDFHSFGGLPGNKITPIVISICASAGLAIPKLSSRAISSACGTADFVETFCRVDLDTAEVRRVTEEVGGVFSWTGSTDLGPAGDMFITIQRPLGIDPRPQMLASILSKKVAAGATHLVIDIPTGPGTKVTSVEEAREYARDLEEIGNRLGIQVECAVNYSDQPLGEAVGPILEARECMQVLENVPGHEDVAAKAVSVAAIILEMAGFGNGRTEAERILRSGEARRKFVEIVAAQRGNPDVRSEDMIPGKYSSDIIAGRDGFVSMIHNKKIVKVAKSAGAPSDKGAGLLIHRKRGARVSKGDILFTIYADNEDKLRHAVADAEKLIPVEVGGLHIVS